MALSKRWLIGLTALLGVCLFVVGIIIGHFAIEKSGDGGDSSGTTAEVRGSCASTSYNGPQAAYKDRFLSKCESRACYQHDCHTEDLPRTYVAYHLNGRTINIDGKLDDEAWIEVPWTDSFMDIRGPDYPEPYFDTKVKVRWDDTRLYVGARMEETHFWGNYTQDETHVWKENAFEVYAVPDGSLHNYKEMQINVLNTTWDLMLRKAYMDADQCTSEQVAESSWSSGMQKATFADGVVNDPQGTGTYWSAEWSFSFEKLAESTDRPSGQASPNSEEAWFFIFARPQYSYKIVNGRYTKDETAETQWWSWQPMYTVNLHLPSRFGLVQFKRDMDDKQFHFNKWHIYRALFEVFDAMHRYKSTNGMFVDSLEALDIAPKIMSSTCVNITASVTGSDFRVMVTSRLDRNLQRYKSTNGMFVDSLEALDIAPKIMSSTCVNITASVTGSDFRVMVTSRLDRNLQVGNIRADRYVWFT